MRALIEKAGAILLYLPPYSPDFNPIENAFAKLKALLRKAAERTSESVGKEIGRLLETFTQSIVHAHSIRMSTGRSEPGWMDGTAWSSAMLHDRLVTSRTVLFFPGSRYAADRAPPLLALQSGNLEIWKSGNLEPSNPGVFAPVMERITPGAERKPPERRGCNTKTEGCHPRQPSSKKKGP